MSKYKIKGYACRRGPFIIMANRKSYFTNTLVPFTIMNPEGRSVIVLAPSVALNRFISWPLRFTIMILSPFEADMVMLLLPFATTSNFLLNLASVIPDGSNSTIFGK